MFQWRSLDPALVGNWLESLVRRSRESSDSRRETGAPSLVADSEAASAPPARAVVRRTVS